MESKKSKNASLESTKVSHYLMGLIVGLAILFVGFEWRSSDLKMPINTGIVDIKAETEIDITRPEETPPPPPPPPVQATPEILEVVDNNAAIDQQEMRSTEDDLHTIQVESYVQPSAVMTVEEEASQEEIFQRVEEMPQFPGGDLELFKFLRDNIWYPFGAMHDGISGRVTVGFVVNSDGSIVDATVLRGVDPALDKEALRVVSSMPKWTPGKQRGKPVRVKYAVPVTFKLN
ncbi:MAG: energy transducer TonB [Tannerellaceae bacterium]|jgi:protein TonB|nr:energy transducer TonB [Tannerellaceae bacterium]